MERQYSVSLNGRHCGKVTVTCQGLYYRIQCRCQLPSDEIYRLQAAWGNQRENLGVLVPAGDMFGLDTKFPAKRLRGGEFSFSVYSKRVPVTGKFYPIRDDEPFGHIARLKESFLMINEGQLGIQLK